MTVMMMMMGMGMGMVCVGVVVVSVYAGEELKFRMSEKQRPSVVELAQTITNMGEAKINNNRQMSKLAAFNESVTEFNAAMPTKNHKLRGVHADMLIVDPACAGVHSC